MPDAITPPSEGGPLSWRDVYRAVGELETRINDRFDRLDALLDGRISDHEHRIQALERVRDVEAAQGRQVRQTFGDLRTVVLLIIVVLSLAISFYAAVVK